MRRFLRLIGYAGACTVILLCATLFLMGPVQAAEMHVSDESRWSALSPASLLILALGAGCIVCLAIALKSARRKDAWPHWRSLLLGFGEAAFLVGIIGSFSSMSEAFHTIASMGAAVTPADIADGYSRATERLVMGGWVALIALIGSAVLAIAASGAAPLEDAVQ